MPKLKTKKAVLKRIQMTKRGKFRRFQVGRRHLLGHKSSKRTRRLRRSVLISKVEKRLIKKLLPYGRK